MNHRAVVVDTNVVSYLFKGDSRGEPYKKLLDGRELFVAFQTIAELDFGALKANWGVKRRGRLEQFLTFFPVVEYDRDLRGAFALARVQSEAKGRSIESADTWIAATALALGVPLVTHNPSDFEGVTDLEIITALEQER